METTTIAIGAFWLLFLFLLFALINAFSKMWKLKQEVKQKKTIYNNLKKRELFNAD